MKPKERFFTQDPYCRFHASGYRLQVPIIFHVVLVGSNYPFKRHQVPHFPQNLTHFSRFTPIFTHIFPVFVLYTPILTVFYISIFSIDPQFSLFYVRAACGNPVMLLPLRGSGFGIHLPPKIGSLGKTFLLASFQTLNSKWVRPFASNEGVYPKHNMLGGKSTPDMITN